MQLAILGAGNVGAALGKGWARAGHAIVYGVRDPTKDYGAVAREAGNAAVKTVREAVGAADAVVLAVTWQAVPDVITACGDLAGRILIDVTNPLGMSASGLGLEIGFTTSGGEKVAELAPGAAVFKTMNQVGYAVMAEASGYPVQPVMFVAGDDAAKKPAVMGLVNDLGFAATDAGPLANARLLEPYAMLWIDQALYRGAPNTSAFAFLRGK